MKILAVDDRKENLLALEGVLSAPHYEVVSMKSGEDALRYLLLEDVSDVAVILMDVQMPGLNGFETVKLIKQRERCQEIPVIFLTAISTSIDHVRQGYHAGSIDYLFKPIDPELLKLKVDAFVKLHEYHRKIVEQGELLRKRALELEESNRKFAEADALLKRHNEMLESVVAERTRELVDTNEKLRKSREHFRQLFMSSPCLMAIRRTSDMAYVDMNESWKQHTGYGDEAVGRTDNLLHVSLDPAEEGGLERGSLRNVKMKYMTKAREIRDGLLSTEVIELDGEKCMMEVAVDVTDKIRLEKEMSRLGELNLIGEMAAGIAHEIRNPMTTIRGFLQLSQNAGGRMEKEHIDMMLGELDRANGIITEYLSLAKNKQTHLRPSRLNRLLESLLPLIQAEATMSGKHVHTEFGECPELALDEKEIRQLVLNLSLNGLEAMSPGGVLTITTRLEGDRVILSVADQGEGIREHDLDKLGRPFFTTKENGTGLGLAVCYSVAARHRAAIDVESGTSGTKFSVRFPVLEEGGE